MFDSICICVPPGFRFPEEYTPPPSTRSRSRGRVSQQVRFCVDLGTHAIKRVQRFTVSLSQMAFLGICSATSRFIGVQHSSRSSLLCPVCHDRRQRRRIPRTLRRRWRRPACRMSSSTMICDPQVSQQCTKQQITEPQGPESVRASNDVAQWFVDFAGSNSTNLDLAQGMAGSSIEDAVDHH